MKRLVFILGITTLAACGADAPPMKPSANVGVSVGTNGVSTKAFVGASNGILSIRLGI